MWGGGVCKGEADIAAVAGIGAGRNGISCALKTDPDPKGLARPLESLNPAAPPKKKPTLYRGHVDCETQSASC